MALSKRRIEELLSITEKLNRIRDIDALLDHILYEARSFTGAEAGSIFLREGKYLKFSYVQNDALAKIDETNNKYIYSIFEIEINKYSLAGYVAQTGESLNIPDVYRLKDTDYTFNRDFDQIAHYRTKSVLAVPLVTSQGTVIGVMQIINKKNRDGKVVSFTRDDIQLVNFFANNASVAIERAIMTREIILRMIKMTELRDPKETGNHVNRVGSYAIEIYDRWAKKRGISDKEIRLYKDTLRIAAMLHDVGKVAVSDVILKKPGKLTESEFAVIKAHPVYGARLFADSVSDWDKLAAEVSLNHHEKWDGTGYPGYVKDIFADPVEFGPGKKGEEIPISGRIVALADVYDALISRRVYKDPWDEEKVLAYIRSESGKQFDPEVVEAFFEIYDVIKAIRAKYSDKENV
ncbi:HD domain-containing phosphohydrolase [Thermospira aquatica]|uniref:GAF domain-containing protein n=1 Tax=Thermospira aquatica TaxID=2828656 RepID=A0AAX3BB26_9SPIR|nr:HD domain-containing phosphohydrolase [Thermospira aquatica]URA09460.1 GAF domain-containing protein [Thermospira aquatica]